MNLNQNVLIILTKCFQRIIILNTDIDISKPGVNQGRKARSLLTGKQGADTDRIHHPGI